MNDNDQERRYHRDNQWWVSPYNFTDEVRAPFQLPGRVKIHDATLRDGEQTPGVVLRKEHKVRIARKLDELGIDRIEAGMPAVSAEDFEAIKEISSLGLNAEVLAFARAVRADIDKVVECGADGVVIEVPIGYPKLTYQFQWSWEDVFRRSAEVINYAKEKGLYVVYFPYDTTRAREEDLENLLRSIKEHTSPDSVGIVDTMGCALPPAIAHLVKKVKALTGLPVEIHTHNDFGMAVATEIAAVTAGAEVVHGCINGLGERTGNAAVEELMMALHVLLGYETRYRFDKIAEIAELASELTGIPIARNKPVTGAGNFTRESGIGVDLVVKEPLAMFATDPKFTGRKGEVVLGKKSGKLSVTYSLQRLGRNDVDEEQIAEILARVKSLGIEKRALLSDEEFSEIVARVTGTGR